MGKLAASGKPLFFRLGNAAEIGLTAPVNRLGEAVRAHVRSLSSMQKEALLVGSRNGSTWRLASDEGAYLDGDDEAPCPLSFLTTGMVCSTMNEILALARQRDIAIDNIRLVQDNYYTMQGSMLKGTMTGGARDVELEAQIASSAPSSVITTLVHEATVASPLHGLVNGQSESLFSLQHNARPLACQRVEQLESAALTALADSAFEASQPAAGNWNVLIARNGMTPKTEETTGFAGSSLAEHQDRILHVRGICSLLDDGSKHVEQLLYNPHGSIFHFLSDETPENGGQGRAPDAATYMSAGIAFCFMTQLGRYARITKRALDDYRIVQDTHFSLGGAANATNESVRPSPIGKADPVETHVSLTSDEPDEFAQTALDMSEQTCFLHALCRTALKTRIRIVPFSP